MDGHGHSTKWQASQTIRQKPHTAKRYGILPMRGTDNSPWLDRKFLVGGREISRSDVHRNGLFTVVLRGSSTSTTEGR